MKTTLCLSKISRELPTEICLERGLLGHSRPFEHSQEIHRMNHVIFTGMERSPDSPLRFLFGAMSFIHPSPLLDISMTSIPKALSECGLQPWCHL